MSAVAAQSLNYVLIPGGDGFPSIISASDAQSRIQNQEQCDERAGRFSELLEQRGAGHVPFWFAGSDVIIHGDEDTAWSIHNVVHKLPHMMRSAKADNDNAAQGATAQSGKAHIGNAFAEAVNPLLKAPDVASSFQMASAYEAVTGNRMPRFGYRAQGAHLVAA